MEPCRSSGRVPCSATIRQVNQTELVLTCHETMPLSSPACDDAWRWFTAKRFCGNGFALFKAAKRFSSSARTVTAGTATAVPNAANKAAASSGDPLTGATNGVPKDGSIIAIGSGRTGAACVKSNRA